MKISYPPLTSLNVDPGTGVTYLFDEKTTKPVDVVKLKDPSGLKVAVVAPLPSVFVVKRVSFVVVDVIIKFPPGVRVILVLLSAEVKICPGVRDSPGLRPPMTGASVVGVGAKNYRNKLFN